MGSGTKEKEKEKERKADIPAGSTEIERKIRYGASFPLIG